MHIDKKRDFYIIIFNKISAAYIFEINFIIAKHHRLKITRFLLRKKWRGRFVLQKYFSNFLGTVPTLGFRILIVINVGSQSFIEN